MLFAAAGDGCLLGADGSVPPANRAAVEATLQRGDRFAVITRRPLRWGMPLLASLPAGVYGAFGGGSTIVDPHQQIVAQWPISAGALGSVLPDLVAQFPEVEVAAEVGDQTYRLPGSFIESLPAVIEASLAEISELGPNQLHVRVAPGIANRERLVNAVDSRLALSWSDDSGRYQATAMGVDKGTALAWIGGRLHVPQSDWIALGVNAADGPMLRRASLAVGVGDDPQIRRMSAVVVGNPHHDGVAQALERITNRSEIADFKRRRRTQRQLLAASTTGRSDWSRCDEEELFEIAQAGFIADRWYAPFILEGAERMLPDLRRDMTAPGGRTLVSGRDGLALAIALRELDPEFYRTHCGCLLLSRMMLDAALQDMERRTGIDPLPVPAFRKMRGYVQSEQVDGAHTRLLKAVSRIGIFPDAPEWMNPTKHLTLVDTSGEGSLGEGLHAALGCPVRSRLLLHRQPIGVASRTEKTAYVAEVREGEGEWDGPLRERLGNWGSVARLARFYSLLEYPLTSDWSRPENLTFGALPSAHKLSEAWENDPMNSDDDVFRRPRFAAAVRVEFLRAVQRAAKRRAALLDDPGAGPLRHDGPERFMVEAYEMLHDGHADPGLERFLRRAVPDAFRHWTQRGKSRALWD